MDNQIKRHNPTIIAVAVLVALCGVAFYLRVYPGYNHAFVGDWVLFRDTDAYYYLRNIENMVRNFPHFNRFDPYLIYPGGGGLSLPFFVWLIAGAARILGSQTPHAIATVAAYVPPILGALTLVPVYFIGKELFSRWAGLIAAALVAILPGEFLHRSLLGSTDHHVAEVLLSTTAALFFIMAIKRFRERGITFHHVLAGDWSTIVGPLVYALLSGAFLGIYLLAWGGGLMFAFILFVYLVAQFVIDHLRRKSVDYLCLIGTPLFLTTLLVFTVGLSGRVGSLYLLSLTAAAVLPSALSLIARSMSARKPVYYPIALLLCTCLGFLILRAVSPSLFQSLAGSFSFLFPSSSMRTVMEVQPLSLRIAWSNFTTAFFLSIIAFVVLAYVIVRERSANKTLLLVWSLVMLISTLGQRRFGYYYTVNAALLTGYLSWKALDLAGLYKLLTNRAEGSRRKEFRKPKKGRGQVKPGVFTRSRTVWGRVVTTGAIVFLLVFLPNIGPANAVASRSTSIYSALRQGWYESCLWLRDNTPEPFGDTDYYYQLYPYPQGGHQDFDYPDTFYGVLSWWDYGYFIAQIGHRVPNANPSQGGAIGAARFFTAQDASTANEIVDQRESRYIMIDYTMPSTKFYAMVEWAGGNVSDFFDVYYQTREGQLESLTLYYPTYYRSLAVRLYNFDGQAVTPTETIVIAYEDRVGGNGIRHKQITQVWRFSVYEEAEAYISDQGVGNYRIVGADPFDSPVPLDEMVDYELVYSSPTTVPIAGRTMPGVKIFEYHSVDRATPPLALSV